MVRETNVPLSDAPKVVIGTKPIDGGYLIFNDDEASEFICNEPDAVDLMRPFLGGTEFINGRGRWLLVCDGVSPSRLRSLPNIMAQLDLVKRYRLGEIPARKKEGETPKSPGISSRALAATPTKFHVTVLPDRPFLALPENSSERREYIPLGWLQPPTVPSNKLRIARDIEAWQFGVLTSQTHMAWCRYIGGRIKSDFQYSISLNYNAFPWPALTDADKARLNDLAQTVLDARAAHPGATLADLYDPDVMPADLRKAHRALDLAVDRLYRKAPFDSDRERVEHLFMLYEKMTTGLLASPGKTKQLGAKGGA